jgi:hypothetical protein
VYQPFTIETLIYHSVACESGMRFPMLFPLRSDLVKA